MRKTCEWERYPLSVSLSVVRIMCSTPVALSLICGRPRPSSLSGRCTSSVGKMDNSLVTCLMALLSIPSIMVSCRAMKTPRCVAWYLDLRSCSTTRVLYVGLRFFLQWLLLVFGRPW